MNSTHMTPAAPAQDALVAALAQAIVNAKTTDGTNPIMEALAQATGYQIVPEVIQNKKPTKRRKDYCKTTSNKKENGQLKARPAEPLRSTDDIRAIGDYLLTHGNKRNRQRNYTLFICGITLGLRAGDIRQLKIGDVFDVATNSVLKHAQIINRKNHKRTNDLITPHAAQAITDLIDEIRSQQSGVLDPEWPLFQSQKWVRAGYMTEPVSKAQVYHIITGAAKACHVEGHISTHSMRKTYGRIAVEAADRGGLTTNQINEALQYKYRHSDQATTMRYIGVGQDQVDAMALCVDAALGGGR